jgi:hypothetical protein
MTDFSLGAPNSDANAGNIYLNGGKNIAEGLRFNMDPNSINSSRMSIAQRMKQNRDMMLASSNVDA